MIAEIRAALADACTSVGLNASGYITDDIQTPAAIIGWTDWPYDYTFGRASDGPSVWTITLIIERTDETGAQVALDDWIDYASPLCVKTVLEAEAVREAAGVEFVWVRRASGVQQIQMGSVNYLSVELSVEVVV